jgi:predicted nucleic acid-binding protein
VIVVDASAALEVFLNTPAAPTVAARLFDPRESLHAPHLIDVEVAQVLRRYATAGAATPDRCRTVLADLADLSLQRHPHTILLPRIWELRHNLTAYDAVYVALAEALDAPLVTRDARLAGASGHRARVEVL